jgi:hypothetical protein
LRALARIPNANILENAFAIQSKPKDRFLDYALYLTVNDLADPWLKALDSGELSLNGREAIVETVLTTIEPRKAGKSLGHFHACGSDRGTPGKDHIDWKPIARALKDIGYRGDVVIESFTTDVKVIARAAAIWRRIEPTQDEIAVKGLKFLRKTL